MAVEPVVEHCERKEKPDARKILNPSGGGVHFATRSVLYKTERAVRPKTLERC